MYNTRRKEGASCLRFRLGNIVPSGLTPVLVKNDKHRTTDQLLLFFLAAAWKN